MSKRHTAEHLIGLKNLCRVKERELTDRLTSQLVEEAQTEHKRLYPRRRIYVERNLPAEFRERLQKKYVARFQKTYKLWGDRYECFNKALWALGDEIDIGQPTSKMNLVKSAHGGNHRSQGFGANKYARGTLIYDQALLQRAGFDAEIRTIPGKGFRDQFGNYIQYDIFELWANCKEWQLEAVLVRYSNAEEWDQMLWKAGINPKVYWG